MAASAVATPSLQTRLAKNSPKKAAWLDERRGYLGATDVGAILGVNPYVSAHDVWLDKKGLKDDESTLPMRAGTYMESFIAAEFQREHSGKIARSKLYRHSQYPFLACNPDREITWKGIPALLECKNVGHWAARNFGQDGSDQVPQHYLTQVMWQLLITKKPLVVLAALIDDRELRTFFYTLDPQHSAWAHVFDREEAKRVFNYAIHWWRTHVEGDEEPEMSGHDSDSSWLKDNRPSYENGLLTNTDKATDRECVRLGPALKRLARAEYAVNEHKNRIKRFMAEAKASDLESTVGTFTWRTNARGVSVFKTPFKTEKA